ncbi:translin, partial [Haematococcus lacustris]
MGAHDWLRPAEGIAQELLPVIQQHPSLRAGSYAASMEEYAEAQAFLYFLREGRLVSAKELTLVEPEEYLGGILDMTGELNRYAVLRATARDTAAVARCRDLVDSMMGKFLQLNLRNGNLRKKYDVLKYTLKKLENT